MQLQFGTIFYNTDGKGCAPFHSFALRFHVDLMLLCVIRLDSRFIYRFAFVGDPLRTSDKSLPEEWAFQ